MSAAEIVTVIKDINEHVTNKYCQAIYDYLTEKSNAHLLFEREFFNKMDQSVQTLVNEIIGSLKTPPSRVRTSSIPNDILQEIQKHCNKYNELKKTMYDNHLAKIKEFEKKFIEIIQQTLKEKVTHQNNLFDTAILSPPAHAPAPVHAPAQQNMNQDIISALLNMCQMSQNQATHAPNTQNMNIKNNQYVPNVSNMQNIQNTFFNQPLSTTPIQTSSVPTNNNMNQVNQINQFLSFLSNPASGNGNGNDNICNDNATTSTISVPNGIVAGFGVNNDNNINMNDNNNNSMINNNNVIVNNMSNTNPPARPPIPLNTPNSNKKNAQNNAKLQLKNLLPIHYGSNKAPLQPLKIINTTTHSTSNNNTPQNTRNNMIHANSRNTRYVKNSSDRNGKSGTNNGKSNISLTPTAPPKPPPPPKPSQYDSSDESSNCDDNDNEHRYECTSCNIFFDTEKEWKLHLKKSHVSNHSRKKRSKKKPLIITNTNNVTKNSKHKRKSKRNRKRIFSKLSINNNCDGSHSATKTNKRRRQIFPCELCNKQFSRLASYVKHYNHHMITNQKHICNFCLNQFRNQNELKKHINAFNGGMLIQNGHYQCCQCSMKFGDKINLQLHIKDVHIKK